MTLPGQVQGAIPSVLGFDSATVITPSLAQQFWTQAISFACDISLWWIRDLQRTWALMKLRTF